MNIKFICLLLSFVGVFALISNAYPEDETVPSAIRMKYLPYIDCVLDRDECDFVGEKVKQLLPQWFENECANCDSFIKSKAKAMIPDVQKYFPEDWQSIEQKYGGNSSSQKVYPKFPAASKPSAENRKQRVHLPKFSAPSKPEVQEQEIYSESEKPVSIEEVFANDKSFGARAVICLIKRKGCDDRMKFFKKSMFLFATVNTCPGCQKPTVLEWFTNVKNFLEKSFPEVLQDIIANKGE